MPVAAVPDYLPRDFKDASPGLRFGLLLPIWTSRSDQKDDVQSRAARKSREGQEVADMLHRQGMDVTIAALRQRERGRVAGVWDKNDFAARDAWGNVKVLTKADQARMKALFERQSAFAETAMNLLRLNAKSVAPFTTGLGNEHPLENGFAFLNPYGLPYLPGSGVKGVLRQAARELASGEWGERHGWSEERTYTLKAGKESIALSVIDVLFGLESGDGDTQRMRGGLSFWDVMPQIMGDSLMVEIMTPHQSHYYQQKPAAGSTNPHDSGSPNPICFLTVPPGSIFSFHVICDLVHLSRLTCNRTPEAPDLLAEGSSHWKELLHAAFQHAFDWLGFGAKTAVGYGAMEECGKASGEAQTSAATEEQGKRAPASGRSKNDLEEIMWERARLKFNARNGTLIAVGPNNAEANALAPRGPELLASLPAEVQRKVRANEFVRVVARVRGTELITVEVR